MKRLLILALMISAPITAHAYGGRGSSDPGTGSELDSLAGKGGFLNYAPYLPSKDSSSCSSVCSRPVETGHMNGRDYVPSAASRAQAMADVKANNGPHAKPKKK